MTYTIVATKGDSILKSERESLLLAAARATVWSRVGWHVVVTDGDGKTLDPAELDRLRSAPDTERTN